MSIATENAKPIRKAMTITADIQQTTERPTNVSATNIVSSLSSYARLTETTPIIRLMDLSGSGFLNDGGAHPVSTVAISGKYGYITEPTDSEGQWTNQPAVTMTCATEWSALSFTVQDSDGTQTEVEFDDITWSSGTCTLTFTEFTANKRMYIVAVNLGKTFHFNNDDLISLTCDLRGVDTSLDEGQIELEMSSVDMSAYCGQEADRWIDVFASMDKSSPCRVSMGYEDDSVTRTFYVSEQPTYDASTKVLTVRMADATQLLDDNYGGKFTTGTTTDSAQNYYNAIKDVLSDINYTESGTVPTGAGSGTSNILLSNDSKRTLIAKAVTLFRDPNKLAITYRDGGIPQLIAGQTDVPVWELNEEDVADLSTDIEYIVRDFSASLSSYVASGTDEEVASQQGAVAGEEYIIDCTEPVASITSATKGTAQLITPYRIKFTCTTSGDATVTGKKIIADTVTQYKTPSEGRGVSVTLDDMQRVDFGVATSIPGYTLCEWVASSGTQYIDTGIALQYGDVVELDYQITTKGAYKTLFGVYDGTGRAYAGMGASSNYYLRIGVAGTVKNSSKKADTSRHKMTATFTSGSSKLALDGTNLVTNTATGNLPTDNCFLFGENNNGSLTYGVTARVYGFKITRNGTVIMNLAPAYDTNNVIGFYDHVTEEFFTNDGTGTFTKGADTPGVVVESLTESGMRSLLDESNLRYSFTWRGNPHWQTMDHIQMNMMDGSTKQMTLVAQAFNFESGGLTCDCTAREGWF